MAGRVTILDFNHNADSIVSAAGRISTTQGSADAIYQKSLELGREKNTRLIEKILSSGHTSVLEHISLNLSFENVSVLVEQFMIEFRLASFTVKSRRYVDFGNAGYFTPDFSACGARAAEVAGLYAAQVENLFGAYGDLIAAGVPKEDARFVLPYCFHSNFYCTVNARELIHIMNEMVYGRGRDCPELAALGEALFTQCEAALPFLARRMPEAYAAPELPLPPAPDRAGQADGPLVTVVNGPSAPEEMLCRAALLGKGMEAATLSPEQQRALLQAMLRRPRQRELEQACFTLVFNRLSLAALTHLCRHRMQSLVAPDLLRCCDPARYVLPRSVEEAGMAGRYRQAFQQAGETRKRLSGLGMRPGDGAYLLLSGQTVPVMTTMNAHELAVFFMLRTCRRAQWEIRESAEAALEALREQYPLLFSCYGPTCVMTGKCPEGAMTCGRMREMAERFGGTRTD